MRLRTVSERVLASLPGPRIAWLVAWALVPWVNAAAHFLFDLEGASAVWEQSRTLVLLNYASLSFAILVTVWGAERLARRAEALRSRASSEGHSGAPFSGMNGVAGPVVASIATAGVFAVDAFIRDGWASALLRGATWFVLGIALWAFLWTYGALQLGLDRLGRERLRPDAARVDPGLGVRPLGDIAFMALWLLLLWLVPLVLTGLPDVAGVAIGLTLLCGGLSAFFLSLLRLHRRMVEVKENELAFARGLYAEAYEPVRAAGTLEVLEQQRNLLGAAGALEQRAHSIHEWPIDEGTFARVATITTSVVAITIARLLLDPLGL